MSTYLLFFALGDFERATAKVEGTELGVVTRRGAIDQARFALDSSKDILREYNDYFGVRYPLPKLDNIAGAGRSQFFGAMENWGAIFTFEYALLFDPASSTQHDRQEIFATAAHEMAHQWFGDLVTMRWWDDLWLNEGFASWMESRMTARLHPEWNTRLGAVGSRDGAMQRDSVATTHPVVQHIETVEQANQAFDEITYQKGEAVIRMLEAYVGENAWRSGVRSYMKAHAYGNTVSDDLWKQIEKAAGKPVTAIAHDFTLQPGVPLIRVGEPELQQWQRHHRGAADPGRILARPARTRSRWPGACRSLRKGRQGQAGRDAGLRRQGHDHAAGLRRRDRQRRPERLLPHPVRAEGIRAAGAVLRHAGADRPARPAVGQLRARHGRPAAGIERAGPGQGHAGRRRSAGLEPHRRPVRFAALAL
jgi:hypothetical protein